MMHTDHVGSLLRPAAVLQARDDQRRKLELVVDNARRAWG